MKTKTNKQIFFGVVIFSLAAMMMTSQMPQAFANDINCINETLTGTINDSIIVPKTNGFNICVLDNVSLFDNIKVEENAAVFVIGSTIEGNVELDGKFSSINYEGTDPNVHTGNLLLKHVDSYAFIESLTLNGNINSLGELYISSDRGSGPVMIDGSILLDSDGTTEFRMTEGTTVTGNVKIKKQQSIDISGSQIGGNLQIEDSFNSFDPDFEDSAINIESNNVNGNLIMKSNDLPIDVNNNTFGGNANCNGNDSVSGNGNTFDGKPKGQCKNLDK